MKKVISFAVLFLFTNTTHAEILQGSFQVTEVEPILVWEYVSETCTRTEYQNCNCTDTGCDTCSYDVYYECGSDQWVRKGSKPLFNLNTEYKIDLKNVSRSLKPQLNVLSKEIDTGYGAETFIYKLIRVAPNNIYFYATSFDLRKKSQTSSSKDLELLITGNLIDSDLLNKDLVNRTLVRNKTSLELADEIPLDAIELEVCVGQDRILSRTTKNLGCQKITEKKTELKNIALERANPKRKLVYFFNWKMRGTYLSGYSHTNPFLVLNY